MSASRRVVTVVLVVMTMALTIGGLVFAATDSNATGKVVDPLALNGVAPTSTDLQIVVSTNQTFSASATVAVNFVTNALEAHVQIPLFFSSTGVDLRLVDHHLYAGTANLPALFGASWLSAPAGQPPLPSLARAMVKPDVAIVKGFSNEVITKRGSSTTYSFQRANVPTKSLGSLPFTLPTRATVYFTLTTGSQGELSASSLTIASLHSRISIAVTVLSYNQPALIVAPPQGAVKQVNRSILHQIMSTLPIASLLTPSAVTSLGTMRLN